MISMKTNYLYMTGWIACASACCMWGCASSPQANTDSATIQAADGQISGHVEISGASYEEVFGAMREVIREYRFAINRVDGARGVITTYPKQTLGAGSPWDREQTTIGQEFEDLANHQERAIRVQFENGAHSGSIVRATIEVLVYRVHRPNWRVDSQSIRLSTHARSRDINGQIEPGSFRESIGQDQQLAHRLANEIHQRFGSETASE